MYCTDNLARWLSSCGFMFRIRADLDTKFKCPLGSLNIPSTYVSKPVLPQIKRGAAVTFSDGRHLDACNCSLQLTGDLLFAYLASSIRVTRLVASNV